ncbi:MAG: D-alanyl-D-alanine dipeptidase [Myxococcales bacterium]
MNALALALLLAAAPAGGGALIDATRAVSGLRVDIRYATSRNVVGRPLYRSARCLLLPEVARALARAQAALRGRGLGLLAWDCYRPLSVQRELWKVYPHPGFVANPARGSNHNRGAAVDVTLVDGAGHQLEMPTDFDSFEPQAFQGATAGVSPEAQRHREILRAAMLAAGFHSIRKEWWHYDIAGALGLPLLDETPELMRKPGNQERP